MTVREKSGQERAAMMFASVGLGPKSAREAARMLFESGISFESAAVLGQRTGEACTATSESIRKAADGWRALQGGPRQANAWGRPVVEATPQSAELTPQSSSQITEKALTQVIGKAITGATATELRALGESLIGESGEVEERPTTNAWGRKLEV